MSFQGTSAPRNLLFTCSYRGRAAIYGRDSSTHGANAALKGTAALARTTHARVPF